VAWSSSSKSVQSIATSAVCRPASWCGTQRETVPHVDAVVAQHPVDLLDRVLGHQNLCQCERLSDHRDRERGGLHNAERGTRQRVNPLGMHVGAKHLAQERADIRQLSAPPIRICHSAAPTHKRL
jgi:hypothetical protein